MRTSTVGLAIGSLVHVKGAGGRARGTITQFVDTRYVRYRATYDGNERLVPIEKVKRLKGRAT